MSHLLVFCLCYGLSPFTYPVFIFKKQYFVNSVVSSFDRLLVLDEIDQLDSKHHEILYRIFEWPALKDAKIILIGKLTF